MDKRDEKIKILETNIGYTFKDKNLLLNSLMHSSYINENSSINFTDNEKLEFLGDSVLNLITTEYIMSKFKDLKEGDLSKIKSQVISEMVFSKISKDLGLGELIYLSHGENISGGRNRSSLLCDVFEATMGAIFLDSDFYTTRDIALKFLKPKIENLDEIEEVGDYKTIFQEYVQAVYKVTPTYSLIETKGPDHDKVFKVSVLINNDVIATGIEKSKKRAERCAAKNAMEKLGVYDK